MSQCYLSPISHLAWLFMHHDSCSFTFSFLCPLKLLQISSIVTNIWKTTLTWTRYYSKPQLFPFKTCCHSVLRSNQWFFSVLRQTKSTQHKVRADIKKRNQACLWKTMPSIIPGWPESRSQCDQYWHHLRVHTKYGNFILVRTKITDKVKVCGQTDGQTDIKQ